MAKYHNTKIAFLFVCFLFCFSTIEAQETDNAVTQMIKAKNFLFTAQTYFSNSFGSKRLTDYYSVKFTKDSIIGNVPYYGQSFTPQINVTDGGINFISTKFEYSFVEKKNGKILVTILPKDDRIIVQKLFMTIYSDGQTQLDVLCRNKEPVTLNGYISN